MINNIVCPECHNSWDQEHAYDTTCSCGQDCSEQGYEIILDDLGCEPFGEIKEHVLSKVDTFQIDYWPDGNNIDASQENNDFDNRLFEIIEEGKKEQADKILSRLAVIFTDYKNAGFENSAQVTKFIMTEIENIVK